MITHTPLSGFHSHYSHYSHPLLFNKPSLVHRLSKYSQFTIDSPSLYVGTWREGATSYTARFGQMCFSSVTAGICDLASCK